MNDMIIFLFASPSLSSFSLLAFLLATITCNQFPPVCVSTLLRHRVLLLLFLIRRTDPVELGWRAQSSAFPLAYLFPHSHVSLFTYSSPRYSFFLSAGAPFAPSGALYANPNGHDDRKPRVIVSLRSPRLPAYVDDLHVLSSLLPPSRSSSWTTRLAGSDRIGEGRKMTWLFRGEPVDFREKFRAIAGLHEPRARHETVSRD